MKMQLSDEEKKRLVLAKSTLSDFSGNSLSILSNQYKFPTFEWLNLIYLYIMGVEGQFTNLIGDGNRNTFINDFSELTDKIKEQVKLDLIDIKYNIPITIPKQGESVVSAANRKFQDNYNDAGENFSHTIDYVVEDAVDYGSGFMMLWKNAKGELKNKHIDPMKIIFNQYNFAKGPKILTIRKTVREIVNDTTFTKEAIEAFKDDFVNIEDHYNEIVTLHKVATPKTNDLVSPDQYDIWHLEKGILFFTAETDFPLFWKVDAVKRRGFPDALGIGAYEKGFNVLTQLKKNRERMEVVMNIMTKMAWWQKKDGTVKGDKMIGKKYEDLPDGGVILGYEEHKIEPADLGGDSQFNVLVNQMAGLKEEAGSKLTINEALQGKTLPSGYSFALGNQQMEMASSVLKEMQKNYGKWIRKLYKLVITPYVLSVFNSKDRLDVYLNETDIQMIKNQAVNDRLVIAEIQHATNPETFQKPFDTMLVKKEIESDIKVNGFITENLLDDLKKNVKDIDVVITGERKSKAQTQAFIEAVLLDYKQNPQWFSDPTYIKLQKEKAKTDTGLTPDEVALLLKQEN